MDKDYNPTLITLVKEKYDSFAVYEGRNFIPFYALSEKELRSQVFNYVYSNFYDKGYLKEYIEDWFDLSEEQKQPYVDKYKNKYGWYFSLGSAGKVDIKYPDPLEDEKDKQARIKKYSDDLVKQHNNFVLSFCTPERITTLLENLTNSTTVSTLVMVDECKLEGAITVNCDNTKYSWKVEEDKVQFNSCKEYTYPTCLLEWEAMFTESIQLGAMLNE